MDTIFIFLSRGSTTSTCTYLPLAEVSKEESHPLILKCGADVKDADGIISQQELLNNMSAQEAAATNHKTPLAL